MDREIKNITKMKKNSFFQNLVRAHGDRHNA